MRPAAVSDPAPDPDPDPGADAPLRARASILARLNHDLRTPLAQIAARARGAGLDDIVALAQRQLAWLGDLCACARYEVTPPELAPAPAYLHALMQAHGVRHDPQSLPGLALLDARLLAQVLERVALHAGVPLALEVEAADDGALVLAFRTCNGAGSDSDTVAHDDVADSGARAHRGSGTVIAGGAGQAVMWADVSTTLERDDIAPGLVLAAQLVRAMGSCLQQAGAALRFVIIAAPADEELAMPPPPFSARDEPPVPFGDGLTVLLCEPHDAMRDYLTEVFDSAGFTLCYDAAELNGALPALVICADADADDASAHAHERAPRLLHALLPPARPQAFDVVLFKPAPAQQLLDAARRLVEQRMTTATGDRR